MRINANTPGKGKCRGATMEISQTRQCLVWRQTNSCVLEGRRISPVPSGRFQFCHQHPARCAGLISSVASRPPKGALKILPTINVDPLCSLEGARGGWNPCQVRSAECGAKPMPNARSGGLTFAAIWIKESRVDPHRKRSDSARLTCSQTGWGPSGRQTPGSGRRSRWATRTGAQNRPARAPRRSSRGG